MDGHHARLGYHQTLLGDTPRMLAYERAIRALVQPGMTVLDLGTGTGVLAMLAARRGARVHAVESAAVAEVARQLVQANGLDVTVHAADVRSLEPVEPVDLVIGDFMGRFVLDDEMLEAVTAAGRWLKPDGRFCPGELRLKLAPVDRTGGALDVFSDPMLGLDLHAALPYAHNDVYASTVPPQALLAGAQVWSTIHPPKPPGLEATCTFTTRAGVLGGFAGWFEADLSPDVLLDTGPGRASHWGQVLFPMPTVHVDEGTPVRITLRAESSPLVWRWRVDVAGQVFEQESVQRLGQRTVATAPATTGSVHEHAAAGAKAAEAERWDDAVRHYGQAACLLRPQDDAQAPAVYEGLGLAAYGAGRYALAARALLRACDPDLREQPLRYALAALAHLGRQQEHAHWQNLYEEAFGP